MILIAGRYFKAIKNLGKVLYAKCDACSRHTWRDLYKGRRWYTIFFIPLIPGGITYQLRCKYCGENVWIRGKYRQYVLDYYKLTQKMLRKEITKEEYIALTGSEIGMKADF